MPVGNTAPMTIKAVVLDIGGVLKVIDDAMFTGQIGERPGLAVGSISRGLAALPEDAVRGTSAPWISRWSTGSPPDAPRG